MNSRLKLQKACKAMRYTMWRIANSLGLRKGTENFTPFIVLTRSRSGSNLLKNYLNSVSEVECFGEVFRHSGRLGSDRPGIIPHDYGLKLYKKDPVAFIKKYFLNVQPPYVRAAGFKLLYYHSRSSGRDNLWDFLKANPRIRIIHLTRMNLVKVIVSRELAMKTGVWIDHAGESSVDQKVTIAPEYFRNEIECTKRWEAEVRDYFSDHQFHELVFEDLVRRPEDSLNALRDFLGLESILKPVSGTRQQARKPVSDILENFEELQSTFAETEWSEYFV